MTSELDPTHDLVRYQDQRATLVGDRDGVRVWRTDEGDGVGLFVVRAAPDLPRDAPDEARFRAAYRALFVSPGVKLMEVALDAVDRTPAVRSIVALPQPSGGAMFIGSLTIPFRDFAYVFKVQCEEHGLKGVRERTVLDRQVAAGLAEEGPTGITGDFAPYEAHYDVEFPTHPLSRARRWLPRIASHTLVAKELRRAAPFGLPPRGAAAPGPAGPPAGA